MFPSPLSWIAVTDICPNKLEDEEKLFGNIVEELRHKSCQPEVTSLHSLEPFDPAVPHGKGLLLKTRCRNA